MIILWFYDSKALSVVWNNNQIHVTPFRFITEYISNRFCYTGISTKHEEFILANIEPVDFCLYLKLIIMSDIKRISIFSSTVKTICRKVKEKPVYIEMH